MIQPTQRWHRCKRFGAFLLLMLILAGGFFAFHRVAIRVILSRSSNSIFSEVQLHRGLSKQYVLEQLGPPDFQMHTRAMVGERPTEQIGYQRGKHALEMTFVDGKLRDWVETRPLNFETLHRAQTAAIPCCAEDESNTE